MKDNLEITKRILELAKNQDITYSVFPQHFKKEPIWLSNILSDALRIAEKEFEEIFKRAVAQYKNNLEISNTGYGWFHEPEKLIWANNKINQIKYMIYGDEYIHEYSFNKNDNNKAYYDLIMQIDCTALMSPEERIEHDKKCNDLAMEILNEILEKEKHLK